MGILILFRRNYQVGCFILGCILLLGYLYFQSSETSIIKTFIPLFVSFLIILAAALLYLRYRVVQIIENINQQIESRSQHFLKQLEHISKQSQEQIQIIQKEIVHLNEGFESLSSQGKSSLLSLSEEVKLLEKKITQTNRNYYLSFNREINNTIINTLVNDWSEMLDIPITKRPLAYMADRICVLESLSKGRIATSIEDILLRVFVSLAVKKDSLSVIEIGSLFGIGLTAIYEHTRSRFKKVHVTAIDPLDGYYKQQARDIITDEIIDESIFIHNITLEVPKADYTLLKHLSTDQESIDHVSKYRCDVLIIDGDHTYTGVKNDFDLYLPFVNKGGYIIFDDYGVDEKWPDVKAFVDKEVIPNPKVELVGAQWRTAVFRVL